MAKHWKEPADAHRRLTAVKDVLATVEPWEPAAIEQALREAAEGMGEGFGKIVHPLRLALTGSAVSPGIDAVIAHMGRALVERRIDAALEALR